MSDPWLTIIGIGEDGVSGLSLASRNALAAAEIVVGGERHLALADVGARGRPWSIPFDMAPVLALRGRRVVVVASGDPYWFGAGGSLAAHLDPGEWIAHPAPSTFSLAAARLGWRLEETICLGLHAAPFERLVPVLAKGARIICLVRDGEAAADLAAWLTARGWGASRLWTLAALGGPREEVRVRRACDASGCAPVSPVAVAIAAEGGPSLPRASGLPEGLFQHDGQITKRPVRALALSALAPRPGEWLWDIGAGSGSISIEWALAGGTAVALEARPDRAANIRANAARFGIEHRISIVEGRASDLIAGFATPDAIFFGGGLDAESFEAVWTRLYAGARVVAHAVTLETEALLSELQSRHGGDLMRVEIANAAALGRFRSWETVRPVTQWSVVK